MKIKMITTGATLALCGSLAAATVWVDGASTNPIPPYDTEATAATSLSDAVETADELAAAGDTAVVVRVKDGTYTVTSELLVGRGIRVESVNGPSVTTVEQTEANTRAFCVTNGVVSGFTIHAAGATTTLNSSVSPKNGFAVYLVNSVSCLSNCVVENVVSTYVPGSNQGGTVGLGEGSILYDSIVRGCKSSDFGGGIFAQKNSQIIRCVVSNNRSEKKGGGIFCYSGVVMYSTLVCGNVAKQDGGGFYGNFWTGNKLLSGCTFVSNAVESADGTAGGVIIANQLEVPVRNCIIANNTVNGQTGKEYTYQIGKTQFYNCYLPSEPTDAKVNSNNVIGTNPDFIDAEHGDYRLWKDSPCIDAGGTTDAPAFDLARRSHAIAGKGTSPTPDIGCYEYDPQIDVVRLQVAGTLSRYNVAGETIYIDASLAYAGEVLQGTTYTWNFGDGSEDISGTDQRNVSHAFAAPGTYRVAVRASSGRFVAEQTLTCVIMAVGRRYLWVTPNGEHASDYDSPTNAVAAAKELIADGEPSVTVVVAPGSYRILTPIVLDEPISVIGVEGPASTVFRGPNGDAPCIVMATVSHPDAIFAGIAIDTIKAVWAYRNKSTIGANVSAGVISNCVIRGIESVWFWNAPSHGCALTMTGGLATEVVITNNVSSNTGEIRNGSPVKLSGTALMDRCVVRDNECQTPYSPWLENHRNRKDELAGGGVYLASGSPICRNTLIVGNRTQSQPGAGAYVAAGTLENCTVAGNYMLASTNAEWSSGVYAWPGAKVLNCISDANMNGEAAINAGGEADMDASTVYRYSCLPGFPFGGVGCTMAAPSLSVDYMPTSPDVLGKGKNADWMKTALDRAGNQRLQGSRVDMGCYECDASFPGLTLIFR